MFKLEQYVNFILLFVNLKEGISTKINNDRSKIKYFHV